MHQLLNEFSYFNDFYYVQYSIYIIHGKCSMSWFVEQYIQRYLIIQCLHGITENH